MSLDRHHAQSYLLPNFKLFLLQHQMVEAHRQANTPVRCLRSTSPATISSSMHCEKVKRGEEKKQERRKEKEKKEKERRRKNWESKRREREKKVENVGRYVRIMLAIHLSFLVFWHICELFREIANQSLYTSHNITDFVQLWFCEKL